MEGGSPARPSTAPAVFTVNETGGELDLNVETKRPSTAQSTRISPLNLKSFTERQTGTSRTSHQATPPNTTIRPALSKFHSVHGNGSMNALLSPRYQNSSSTSSIKSNPNTTPSKAENISTSSTTYYSNKISSSLFSPRLSNNTFVSLKPMLKCTICGSQLDKENYFQLSSCRHIFDLKCLNKLLTDLIMNGHSLDITCPNDACGHYIQPLDLFKCVPRDIYDKYDSLALHAPCTVVNNFSFR